MVTHLKDKSIEEKSEWAFTLDKVIELTDKEILYAYVEMMLSIYSYLDVDRIILLLKKLETQPVIYQELHTKKLLFPIFAKCLSEDKELINKIFKSIKMVEEKERYHYLQMLLSCDYYNFNDIELTDNIIKTLNIDEFRKIVNQLVREKAIESAYKIMKSYPKFENEDNGLLFTVCLQLAYEKLDELKEGGIYLKGAYNAFDALENKNKIDLKDFDIIVKILERISKKYNFDFGIKENTIFGSSIFITIDNICSKVEGSSKIFEKPITNFLESIIKQGSPLLTKISPFINPSLLSQFYLKIISNATSDNGYLSLIAPLITDLDDTKLVYLFTAKERELNKKTYSSDLIKDLSTEKKSIVNTTLNIDFMLQNKGRDYIKGKDTGIEICFELLLEIFKLKPEDFIANINFEQFQKISKLIDAFDLKSLEKYIELVSKYDIEKKIYEKLLPDITKKLLDHFHLFSEIEDENIRLYYLKLLTSLSRHKKFVSYCADLSDSILDFTMINIETKDSLLNLNMNDNFIFLRNELFNICFDSLKLNKFHEIKLCTTFIKKIKERYFNDYMETEGSYPVYGLGLIISKLKKKENLIDYSTMMFQSIEICQELIKIKYDVHQLRNWYEILNILSTTECFLKNDTVFKNYINSLMAFGGHLHHCIYDDLPFSYFKLIAPLQEIYDRVKKKKKDNEESRRFKEFDKKYPDFFIKTYIPICKALMSFNEFHGFENQLIITNVIISNLENLCCEQKNKLHDFYKFFNQILLLMTNRFVQVKTQSIRGFSIENGLVYDTTIKDEGGKLDRLIKIINNSTLLSRKYNKSTIRNEKEVTMICILRTYFTFVNAYDYENAKNTSDEFNLFAKNYLSCALIKHWGEFGEIEKAEKEIKSLDFENLKKEDKEEEKEYIEKKEILLKQLQIIAEFWIYSANKNKIELVSLLLDKIKKEKCLSTEEKVRINARILSAFINHAYLHKEDNITDYFKLMEKYILDLIKGEEDYVNSLTSLLIPFSEPIIDKETIDKSKEWSGHIFNIIEVMYTSLYLITPIESSIRNTTADFQNLVSKFKSGFEISEDMQAKYDTIIIKLLQCYIKIDKKSNDVLGRVKQALVHLKSINIIIDDKEIYSKVVDEEKKISLF